MEMAMTQESGTAMARSDAGHPGEGDALVLQPDEGESHWQPFPANGYATIKIGPRGCTSNFVSMGVQVIAEGGYVREHWHDRHEEILFCFEGRGEVLVDGTPHPFVPGTRVPASYKFLVMDLMPMALAGC